MKIFDKIINIKCVAIFLFVLVSCQKEDIATGRLCFNDNWKFFYGDASDAHLTAFDDSQWRMLDLPHDWSVEMPFSRELGTTANGHTVGGTGWYRKLFILRPCDDGKLHRLYFEGAYMETDVWINGHHAGYNPYGYTSFFCDITPYCKPAGEENIVTVRVGNEGKNTRWYSGSGIYRHVWLETTGRLYLDTWGLYVTTPTVDDEKASVRISAEIVNETGQVKNSRIHVKIKDASGNAVAEQTADVVLNAGERKNAALNFEIIRPDLWSVDSPVLYTACATLISGNQTVDILSSTFGIRSIEFSTGKGFLLNGKPLKLKGGCVHHDNGLLGAVSIDRAEERKVELLKNNGFNAVRCAHNPPAPKFLEACDRLGLLVIDEAFDQWQKQKTPDDYHRFFDEWHEKDLASMILRDRNHPSVIMWSIGNEIKERADSSGIAIAARLKEIVRRHDDTRPVTAAINDFWDNPGLKWADSERAFQHLDICGYNYTWREYENDIRLFPDRIIYSSETTPMEFAANWDLVEKYPCIIGDFVWTALDYLGESGIGHAIRVKNDEKDPPLFLGYPWFNGWCGDIDICGDPKPQSMLRKVVWGNSIMEMAVKTPIPQGYRESLSYWGWTDEYPSWNWEGYENQPIEVRVFTRYPAVRLYLNGKPIEEKKTGLGNELSTSDLSRQKIAYTAGFEILYAPGELKATGIDAAGNEQESVILNTTGAPSKIRLTADRTQINASRNDLAYIRIELVDDNGNVTPDSDCRVHLTVSGNGEITASGNASPTDMESFRSLSPKTYKGKALAIIRPDGNAGHITLTAKAEGISEKSIEVVCR